MLHLLRSMSCVMVGSFLAVQQHSLPGKSVAVKDTSLMGVCRYAYVEFTEPNLVANAIVLNESIFRGRSLKVRQRFCPLSSHINPAKQRYQVVPKRTNLPGLARGRGGGGVRPPAPMGYRGGRGGGMPYPPRPAYPPVPYGYGPPPPAYGPPRGGG